MPQLINISNKSNINYQYITMTEEYTIVFIPQKQREPQIISEPSDTLLSVIRSKGNNMAQYYFLSHGKIIPTNEEGNKKISDVLTENKIFMTKNEPKVPKEEEKNEEEPEELKKKDQIYIVVLGSDKIEIMTFPQELVSNLRINSELKGYSFQRKNGQTISENLESKIKVEEISKNKVIYMKKLSSENEKKEKIQKIQNQKKQRDQKLKKLVDEINQLKKEEGSKEKMEELSKKLKDQNISIEPQKLSDAHSLDSVLETLKGKQSNNENILEYAKTLLNKRSEAESFANNGRILPSVYDNLHKETEMVSMIDFNRTKKTERNQYKQSIQKTYVEYQNNQSSLTTVDITKTSDYRFDGANLNVSASAVTAKFQGSDSSLSEKQIDNIKNSVKSSEKLFQIFVSFFITSAIKFEKDQIYLKQKVVSQFEEIVQTYLKFDNILDLKNDLAQFINKYGTGIDSALYLLGGIYQNKITYTFTTDVQVQDLKTILNAEKNFTISGAVGGSYGPISAEAGFKNETKQANQKAFKNSKTMKEIKYHATYDHHAQPLSSIKDINLWGETIEAFPQNWVIVGSSDHINISLTELLSHKNNSLNNDQNFLEKKKIVLEQMKRQIERSAFKLNFDQNHPQFLVSKNKLTKIKNSKHECQIVGQDKFPLEKVWCYTVQILQSKSMEIAIGICTSQCLTNPFSHPYYHNVLFYKLAGRGTIQYQQLKLNTNILVSEKSKIRVTVDTASEKPTISWQIAGKIMKYPISAAFIKKDLYPYFHLLEKDDMIKIIEE